MIAARSGAVLAADPGGETLVEAKCCLLASGGFSNSREIMDRVLPAFKEGFPTHTFTMAANTGRRHPHGGGHRRGH